MTTYARRSMSWRTGCAVALIAVAAALSACGGSSSSATTSSVETAASAASTATAGGGTLRVLAASSLKEVFPKLAEAFSAANDGAKVEFSFAGSDELATQIQEGAKADVYAAASTKYPDALAADGEVDKPVPFTTNTLVLATPAGSTPVTDLASLAKPGVKLVIGADGVPVGDYTRKVLPALDACVGRGLVGRRDEERRQRRAEREGRSSRSCRAAMRTPASSTSPMPRQRATRSPGSRSRPTPRQLRPIRSPWSPSRMRRSWRSGGSTSSCRRMARRSSRMPASVRRRRRDARRRASCRCQPGRRSSRLHRSPDRRRCSCAWLRASLLDGLRSPVAQDALALSLKTTLVSLVIIVVVGTPVAYVADAPGGTREGRPDHAARAAARDAAGRRGHRPALRVRRSRNRWRTARPRDPVHDDGRGHGPDFRRQPVLSAPGAVGVHRASCRDLEAARASGASATRTLLRIAVPLAAGGLVTGAVLAWARALGEFGATLIFAGSLRGVTETAPLAIYGELDWTSTPPLRCPPCSCRSRSRSSLASRPQRGDGPSTPSPRHGSASRLHTRRRPSCRRRRDRCDRGTLRCRQDHVDARHRRPRPPGRRTHHRWATRSGSTQPTRRFVPIERRPVGLVFQDFALFAHLDARANVAFPLEARGVGRKDRRRRADALLERLGIGHLAAAKPGRLSGGERQRVAIARALARDPQLLLLDEPLSSLDPATRGRVTGELGTLLRELGLTTVIVTHSYDDAAALADWIAVIEHGAIVQTGHRRGPARFTGVRVRGGLCRDQPAHGHGNRRQRWPDPRRARRRQPGNDRTWRWGRSGSRYRPGRSPWEATVARPGTASRARSCGSSGSVTGCGSRRPRRRT